MLAALAGLCALGQACLLAQRTEHLLAAWDGSRERAGERAVCQARRVGGDRKAPVNRDDMRVVVLSEREVDAIVNRMADFGREL